MEELRLLREANLAFQSGHFEVAAGMYEQLLRSQASSLPATAGLGKALYRMGRPAEAYTHLSLAASQECEDPNVFALLGQCCVNLGNNEAAVSAFGRAIQLDPHDARIWLCLAYAFMGQNQVQTAEAHLQKAIELDPQLGAAHDLLAFVLPKLGRFEEAKEHARTASGLDPSNAGYAFRFVQTGRVQDADRDLVERLAKLEKSISLTDKDRIRLEFALGKAFEDLSDYRESASHYVQANELALKHASSTGQRFDAEEHRREVDYILSGFPSPQSFRPTFRGSSSELPVLIIGMMRSGTTLVEQILSSHPLVGGAGEVPFWLEAGPEADYKVVRRGEVSESTRVAEDYVKFLEARCPGMARVCDKLPQNYMNLGIIHSLLPEARIIHCRRDPKDVCLSLFTTPFGIPPPFAYSAKNIAAAYRQYLRLVQHWRSILPRDRFLEVDYESLVAQKEDTARKMVAFIGQEWDDACLYPERNPRMVDTPSQWQVRQPVYGSSIGRWKRFAEWMKPQFEIWGEL